MLHMQWVEIRQSIPLNTVTTINASQIMQNITPLCPVCQEKSLYSYVKKKTY